MRNFILPAICIVMLVGVFAFAGDDKQQETYEGIIRFHVIANSNSKEDQELKLKIRDEVLAQINDDLLMQTFAADDGYQSIAKGSADLSREYINENIDKIKEKALEIIEREGYTYSVDAELGVRFIPEKTYGDVTFPAGNYEALSITIGKGKGENWWCVLFPPLCLIDPQGTTLAGAGIDPQGGRTSAITLEFKTKELLDKNK